MANLWVDGFEGYTAGFASLTQGYAIEGGGEHTGSGGRTGGRDLQGSASRVWLGPLNVPAGRTLISGAARFAGESIAFQDNGFNNLIGVATNGVGQFVITPHSGTPVTVTPPMRVLNAWRYWEHKIKVIDKTHLSYECRIDEITVYPATTLNCSLLSTTIDLIDMEAGPQCDDWYVNDDTGSIPADTDYWGDTRMMPLIPNGDHSITWGRSAGSVSFTLVNEAFNDGDATYTTTATAGNRDDFDYQDTNLPPGTTIRTVAIMTSARRLSDSGPRVLNSGLTSAGHDSATGGTHQLSDTYYVVQNRVAKDPNGNISWTPAAVDAATGFYVLTS